MSPLLQLLAFLLMQFGYPHLALAYRPFDSTDADVAKPGELELGPVQRLRILVYQVR
jgi:hypothetical protein